MYGEIYYIDMFILYYIILCIIILPIIHQTQGPTNQSTSTKPLGPKLQVTLKTPPRAGMRQQTLCQELTLELKAGDSDGSWPRVGQLRSVEMVFNEVFHGDFFWCQFSDVNLWL
jgi:hypothetical protein